MADEVTFIVVWGMGNRNVAVHSTKQEALDTIRNLFGHGVSPDEIVIYEAGEGSRVTIDWEKSK